ncbi:MAG TPA: serine hydrolase domain-containing protein [Microbacterium sp.]|nr:serine hydrolase domain-containing protein [Microbacterium sp.]
MQSTPAFDWAARQVERGVLPTAVLGIATVDGIVDIRAYGADGSRRTRPDDVYPLFSVTKPLVGLVALRAVERGMLSLEAPLDRVVPELRDVGRARVRLHHLLTHTSGLSEPPLDAQGPLSAVLRRAGSDFAAGSATRYSSLAFEGVRLLVEDATGTSLDDGLRQALAAVPASGIGFDPVAEPHRVHGGGDFDPQRFASLRHPGAGLYGRAVDLLEIGRSLLADDGAIVTSLALAASLEPRTVGLPKLEPYPAERGQEWGLAWNLLRRAPGMLARDVYGHAGWAGAEFWMLPGAGSCVVLLTNRVDAPAAGLDVAELLNAVSSGA